MQVLSVADHVARALDTTLTIDNSKLRVPLYLRVRRQRGKLTCAQAREQLQRRAAAPQRAAASAIAGSPRTEGNRGIALRNARTRRKQRMTRGEAASLLLPAISLGTRSPMAAAPIW